MFKKLENEANILKNQIKEFEENVEKERTDVQDKLNKIKLEEEKKNQLQHANEKCMVMIENLKNNIVEKSHEGKQLEKQIHKIHK